jgi:adenine specific DNA methylase Mod
MKNTYATKEQLILIMFCSIKYDIGNVLGFFTFLGEECTKGNAGEGDD